MSSPPLTDDEGSQGWWLSEPGAADIGIPVVGRKDGPAFVCLLRGIMHIDWRPYGDIVREVYVSAGNPHIWERELDG